MAKLAKGRYNLLDKQKLQKIIHEYKKRREQYREAGMSLDKITKAIISKRRSLELLEAKEGKVRSLAKLVEEFTGLRLWHSTHNHSIKMAIAKGIFCKYGLEKGYRGTMLGWYLGTSASDRPSRIRSDFQKNFKKFPDRLEAWRGFKEWIKLQEDEPIEDNSEV